MWYKKVPLVRTGNIFSSDFVFKEMKVKIRLSCSDLKKMDRIFGKSDPYVKVMENVGTEDKEDGCL